MIHRIGKMATGAILLSALVLFTSCGSGTANANAQQAAASNGGSAPAVNNGAPASNPPDLYGEVKSVSGNTVTLALLEIPQGFSGNGGAGFQGRNRNGASGSNGGGGNGAPRNFSGGQGAFRNGGTGNSTVGSGNAGNSAAGGNANGSSPNGGTNGSIPNGGTNGSIPGGGSATGSAAAGQNRQRVARNYTGETQTVTIPDGVAITSFTRGNNGMQQEQLKVSDIQAGMLLQIWYKKDTGDAKVIESIRVTPDFQGGFNVPGASVPNRNSGQGSGQSSGQGSGL